MIGEATETRKESHTHRKQMAAAGLVLLVGVSIAACSSGVRQDVEKALPTPPTANSQSPHNGYPISTEDVLKDLSTLAVKGKAPKTGYSRLQFGNGWASQNGCDTREEILRRDMTQEKLDAKGCDVLAGTLQEPYTGKIILFTRGVKTSSLVQIDHVVALGDAWQTGAQQLTPATREQLANDPLELLAADGSANEQKGDSNAAEWLPPNKTERCNYVAKQILVKEKYDLWVTAPERDAMTRILDTCINQTLYVPSGPSGIND